MLPAPPHVEDVWLGSGGALAALPDGALAVDMSTSSPALGRRIAEAAAPRGIGFLDAPVADALKASQGDLHIFVGGDPADVARARPVSETMGRPERVVHVGPRGPATRSSCWSTCSGSSTPRPPPRRSSSAPARGSTCGRSTRRWPPVPRDPRSSMNEALEVLEDGEYGERFPLGLVTKDLNMALELAHETGVPAEVSARTHDALRPQCWSTTARRPGRWPCCATTRTSRGSSCASGRPMAVEAALRIPPRPEMVLGEGAVDDLPELVRSLGHDAAFVITDRGLVEAGVAGLVVGRLDGAGLRTAVHDGVGTNPSAADVLAGSAALRAFGPAVVVALGGGSSIDAAKAIALHAANDRRHPISRHAGFRRGRGGPAGSSRSSSTEPAGSHRPVRCRRPDDRRHGDGDQRLRRHRRPRRAPQALRRPPVRAAARRRARSRPHDHRAAVGDRRLRDRSSSPTRSSRCRRGRATPTRRGSASRR